MEDVLKKHKHELEKDIQRKVCDYLHNHGFFFWRSNNIPVWGRSNDGKMRWRAMPKYSRRGVADIIVLHQGKFIGLEIKRPGEKLKPDQEKFAEDVERNGGIYWIISSVEILEKCLNSTAL